LGGPALRRARAALWKPPPVPKPGELFHLVRNDGTDDWSYSCTLYEELRPPVRVLSHSFWVRRFHADPAITGKLVEYDEVPYHVIGIAEAGFAGLTRASRPMSGFQSKWRLRNSSAMESDLQIVELGEHRA